MTDTNAYGVLRFGGVAFLIINAFHRLLYPQTGVFYTLGEILSTSFFSPENFVFAVIVTSLVAGYFIIIDRNTFEAASLIAFGLSLVVIMLLIQTPYLTGDDITNGFVFFDVALRNFGLVILFVAIALMSKDGAQTESNA